MRATSLFAAATPPDGKAPTDTLAAAESIARSPWHQPEKVFALLASFYPVRQASPRLRPYAFHAVSDLCSRAPGFCRSSSRAAA